MITLKPMLRVVELVFRVRYSQYISTVGGVEVDDCPSKGACSKSVDDLGNGALCSASQDEGEYGSECDSSKDALKH